MASKVATKMGEPVDKVAIVSKRGQGKRMMTAGVIGGVAGQVLANRVKTGATGIENLKGTYFIIGLSPTRLAFFSKKGLLITGPNELLAEIPRTEIASFTVGGGSLTSEVDITLSDGTVIELECPRAQKGKTQAIAAALGLPG